MPVGETAPTAFQPYSLAHAITFALCISFIVALTLLGRAALARNQERRVILPWAIFCFAINIWSWIYWFNPAHFDLRKSMPLELCDMACLVAPISLLSSRRVFSALIFFWGIGLSTQAFFTPTVTVPIATQRWWLFWLLHLVIIATAVYQLTVRKFRPTLKDTLAAIGITATWVASAFVLNIFLGSNYGYVGNVKTERPTFVDLLGDWPARAFLLCAIVIALFFAMWAVFRSRRPS